MLFSGGTIASEGWNADLPVINGVDSPIDFERLNWGSVPEDFSGSAEDLVHRLVGGVQRITALSILCQGYLAAFAVSAKDVITDEVANALDKMGWRSALHGNLVPEKSFEDISSTALWAHVYNLHFRSIEEEGRRESAIPDAEWTEFLASIRREWGATDLPIELQTLLSGFRTNGFLSDPKEVAAAYIALRDHLESQRVKL